MNINFINIIISPGLHCLKCFQFLWTHSSPLVFYDTQSPRGKAEKFPLNMSGQLVLEVKFT